MSTFRRPHHNAVLTVLNSLDGELLKRAECFFGGGTAIVLSLDEYRESVDIDFLCSSQEGYRMLREAVWTRGFSGLAKSTGKSIGRVSTLRDMRADQYGIRTFVQVDDTRIKFEIVRQGRIDLSGQMNERYGVPVLSRSDMFAEKLLANADRWPDKAVYSRDIIDLSMMIAAWGDVPAAAWQKARDGYERVFQGCRVDSGQRMAPHLYGRHADGPAAYVADIGSACEPNGRSGAGLSFE